MLAWVRFKRVLSPIIVGGCMNLRPPVDMGEKVRLSIEAQDPQGQGIAKIEGFVVFVDNAKAGEEVTAKIVKIARTYANAQRLE